MENYREASHPHQEDASAEASASSWSDFRQVLGVVLAGVVIAIALHAVALFGTWLDPDGVDCIMTDNAGCVSTVSDGSPADRAVGAGLGRED